MCGAHAVLWASTCVHARAGSVEHWSNIGMQEASCFTCTTCLVFDCNAPSCASEQIHGWLLDAVQAVHGPLLQTVAAASAEERSTCDVTQLPVALRGAAFVEAADCFTAMISNAEVPPDPSALSLHLRQVDGTSIVVHNQRTSVRLCCSVWGMQGVI